MGFFGKKNECLLKAIMTLEKVDYSADPELKELYDRLIGGRNAFAEIYEMNVGVVSEISTLDMEIKYYTQKLIEITNNIVNATGDIHVAASESSDVAGIVAGRHEELTNTIISVSEESGDVYQKIDTSQRELSEIRKLSDSTITISREMHEDMKQLTEIIDHINEVIAAINSISSQTNLLSLNASIEAARAGDAGRGFAVVADEIRSLADETQSLTKNMDAFVSAINAAAGKSVISVENAIKSLESVNEKINEVWGLSEENQKHMASITDSISNLAAVSEEISSSVNEIETKAVAIEKSCANLHSDTDGLREIGESCTTAIKPLGRIEKGVDDVLKHMGNMFADPFYTLSREELLKYVDGAIAAHKMWIEKLGTIVETKMIVPFQVDETKCKFGHFYHSFQPQQKELKVIWKEIGEMHSQLHKSGTKILNDLFDDKYEQAKNDYKVSYALSTSLIQKFEEVKRLV